MNEIKLKKQIYKANVSDENVAKSHPRKSHTAMSLILSILNRLARMQRTIDASETRDICEGRTMWKFVVSGNPFREKAAHSLKSYQSNPSFTRSVTALIAPSQTHTSRRTLTPRKGSADRARHLSLRFRAFFTVDIKRHKGRESQRDNWRRTVIRIRPGVVKGRNRWRDGDRDLYRDGKRNWHHHNEILKRFECVASFLEGNKISNEEEIERMYRERRSEPSELSLTGRNGTIVLRNPKLWHNNKALATPSAKFDNKTRLRSRPNRGPYAEVILAECNKSYLFMSEVTRSSFVTDKLWLVYTRRRCACERLTAPQGGVRIETSSPQSVSGLTFISWSDAGVSLTDLHKINRAQDNCAQRRPPAEAAL
ncbi:hypothetical protein EVAR_15858_1 [Eumeta japonica]|uniref:Uncharacterized protein n=1 Tax=Eumeta variegata TaxID=151549 RepID=A0A4C1UFA1_EUMVA|nr:hypothetical protein EVAR_15858_1 [Eumeta japonica]